MQTLTQRILIICGAIALASCASPERPTAVSPSATDTAASNTLDVTVDTDDQPTATATATATATSGTAPVLTTAAVDELRRFDTPDGTRQYFLHAPPSDDGAPRPLVVVLHGHGGSSRQARGAEISRSPMEIWLDLAEREQFVVAYPDGAVGSDDAQGWNDCRRDARANPETDDVGFITSVIDDVAGVVAVDRSSVFTVGVSNGGFMSMRMAVERPDIVAASAAIVASMAADSECDAPSEAVSVLYMNGTADPLVPYEGGEVPFRRGGVMSTPDAVELWRDLADAEPIEEPQLFPDLDPDDDATVTRSWWSGAAEVWLYRIDGGGHTEPSITEQYARAWTNIVGVQNHDVEAAEEIWSFFVAAAL